jgi:hypothetical protein
MLDSTAATEAFMYVFLRALTLGGHFINTYAKMLAQGLAISPIIMNALQKSFPQVYNIINQKALGTTLDGAVVLDPALVWPDKLPSLAAADTKNTFIPNQKNSNQPTPSPRAK